MCFADDMSVRGGAIGVLCVLSLLFGLSVLAGLYSVRDPTYSCLVDSPPPYGVRVDVSQPVVGSITALPLGLQCTFTSTDGDTVVQKADWISSVLAVASVTSLAGAGLVALGFRPRRPVAG